MGSISSPEALALRWHELLADPLLADLPYKIELNAWGKIEISPASNRHGYLQMAVGAALMQALPAGRTIAEASILTDIGVRVPDVVWASPAFVAAHGFETPFRSAPEIVVEVMSPSNTVDELDEKTRAYLAAGAVEVWWVSDDGTTHARTADGVRADTAYGVTLGFG
ncbi:MAG: Uma2 family endonuclease [Burkholderiales bacterium]|jgi:Uma2 family endonuclease|nr:Uma2 family endonuclease [Burkholderiales bacterium]